MKIPTVLLFLPILTLGTAFAADQETLPGIEFTGSALPVRVHVNQYRNCYAIAPANWVIYGERREGDALDIGALAEGIGAGWWAHGVPGPLAMSDPYRFGTPEASIHTDLSGQRFGRNDPISYGQPVRDRFGYTWLPYESPTYKGVVIYQVWPVPGDPYGYVVVQRMATARKPLWERQGAVAIAVALSIRCAVQVRPSDEGGRTGRTDDDEIESTYNQQLGMEYAHDPATGENYWMNHGTDWRENGPEGPGYYKQSGNELRKLVPGRSN
jgi:hypothetical protein